MTTIIRRFFHLGTAPGCVSSSPRDRARGDDSPAGSSYEAILEDEKLGSTPGCHNLQK